MHGWLLLIWVQALIPAAFLTSGAAAGTIETNGNISAEEGGSVILQCHFISNTAEVTQVNWEQQDKLLAVYSAERGWHVFSKRVVPGPSLGLTFQLLTMNDTGEYICTYHTYPDGIYKGRIFLKVQKSSAAQVPMVPIASLGGGMAAVLGLLCLVTAGMTVLSRKKSLRIHSMESGLGRMAAEPQEMNLRILSSPGVPVQTEAALAGLCAEEDDYAEPRDYFNVLSYRSLESFSVLAKTV